MKLDKRRRREFKTNYNKRMKLLKGKHLRLIIRKTNKFIILQAIQSAEAQDKVIASTTTKELLKYGWPKEKEGSLKSTTAAYLAGLLIGKKLGKIKEEIILDTGLNPNTKGSRIYAGVKGVSDSGIPINFDEKILPSQDKIEGKMQKIEEIFKKVKGAIK